MDSLTPPLHSYNRWDGIQTLGEMWTMRQGQLELRCVLTTHPMGWELRANVRDELMRSHVAKTDTEVFNISDAWRAEANEKGWA